MRKQITQVLLLVISFSGFSQVKLEKGYFIDNSGTRKECFIKNMKWENNPTEFEYQETLNTDPKTAKINLVQEFGISEKLKYKRFEVAIDQSDDRIRYLDQSKEPKFKTETVFLKYIVEGNAVLYIYQKSNFTRFFYSINDSAVKQLVYKKYRQDGNKIGNNNHFRQQLWNDIRCGEMNIDELKKVSYNSDLIRYFVHYNTCIDPNFEILAEKDHKNSFHINVRPGINVSKTRMESGIWKGFDFGNQLGLRLGLEAEYVLSFNKGKWSAFAELTYQYYKVEDKELNFDSSTPFSDFTYLASIDYSSIEIPVGARHRFFISDRSNIFINGALVFDLVLKSNIALKIPESGAIEREYDDSSSINFAFGIGYTYNNTYSIEARYLTDRNLVNRVGVKGEYSTISFIFGYRIF